ncbi:MAG: RNA ligase family protein [Lachnospiraceae bacterium]|nr:RNA ligase family protein [Lachnospiraceae bacterium]
MKHYIEIQKVRENDIIVDETLTLPKNTGAFLPGDLISITEKIDGANASIFYDGEQNRLRCFSSRNELDFKNQLRGFLPYVQSLDKTPFEKYPDYIFFGEWLVPHSVIYADANYNKWYLFSVYDCQSAKWIPQSFVKDFAEEFGFLYVHELYYGEFVSWEHCFSFANSPSYGEQQEGIVIKNQTALAEGRGSHILKYVNPSFKETQKRNHRKKLEDPGKIKEKAEAEEYIRMIVTEARVIKNYHKLVDGGILPEKFDLKDMKLVAQYLPRAVYEDCVKEELAILRKAGEYGGKLCNKLTMEIIKKKLCLSD